MEQLDKIKENMNKLVEITSFLSRTKFCDNKEAKDINKKMDRIIELLENIKKKKKDAQA